MVGIKNGITTSCCTFLYLIKLKYLQSTLKTVAVHHRTYQEQMLWHWLCVFLSWQIDLRRPEWPWLCATHSQTYLPVNGVVAAFLLWRVALLLLFRVVVDVWGAICRDRGHVKNGETLEERRQMWWDHVLTGHLCFGSLMVDGLAGEGVDPDLGDGHRGVLELAVEPQDLGPLAGVLHHLEMGKKQTQSCMKYIQPTFTKSTSDEVTNAFQHGKTANCWQQKVRYHNVVVRL